MGKDVKERLVAYLKELHLPAFRQSYEELARQAQQEGLSFEQYLLGPGYYTNPAQAPLAYNVLPDWNFDAFAQSLGVTQVATASTVEGLRTALAAAKAHTGGPSVIRAMVAGRSLPAGL